MNINNLSRKIEVFIIIVIIALIGIIYAFQQHTVLAPTTSTQVSQDNNQENLQAPISAITYQGLDGKNALDLLKSSHSVEVKSYSFGDMVVAIDGNQPDQNHFWAFYVNDQLSEVGASSYVTKSTDIIKWQMDEIKSFNQ